MHQATISAGTTVAPVARNDHDHHLVFAELAANRDRRAFRHGGVAGDRLLDLVGGDVLAPSSDDVLDAVDEVQVAVLVEPAGIAGVIPEVLEHLAR